MLETDITKSGEVVVEGHPIGRLDGFQFAADPAAAGPEAKALRAAAQKALAGEINSRAARLQVASDDQILLAADGTIRWIGEAVGKLSAGDETLTPRVRITADEQLSGAARDGVQGRLDLWVKAHIEKLLGPLFVLAKAEDVTGMARGIAFQLVESLAVLERHKVADDVKGLDQAARAILRKYGVRFGAYHIYLPALLKPAPRVLAAQLWALKHGGPDPKGLDEVPHLAGTGRTSMPVNKDFPKALYRTVGYRVCGERAVRVDILERLADIIRPMLAWRPGSPGEKPLGAVDGAGFTVTVAMTSLTGASGEDFASILRSLGYRMERRPRPAEPAPATGVEAAAGADSSAAAPSDAPEPVVAGIAPIAEAPEAQLPPDPAMATPDEPAELTPVAVAVAPFAPTAEEVPATETIGQIADPPAPPSAAASADDGLIEVWRPARSDERRSRHARTRPPRADRPGDRHGPRSEAPRAAADATQPASAEPSPPAADHGAGTPAPRHLRKPPRPSRTERPRQDRPERESGGRPAFAQGPRPAKERREKAPDPNSPFAKLAALKAQLEANAKERR